jgi:hypothetical protein
VPHDIDFRDPKRLLLKTEAKDSDMAEGSLDRVANEAEPATPAATATPPATEPPDKGASKKDPRLVPASYPPTSTAPTRTPSPAAAPAARETIVLDVGGGVLVPDFRGKPLRTCLEQAQSAGLELEVSGSGVAQSQSPPAGSRVPHGGHVVVQFGR